MNTSRGPNTRYGLSSSREADDADLLDSAESAGRKTPAQAGMPEKVRQIASIAGISSLLHLDISS
jgi:hypothetical protein